MKMPARARSVGVHRQHVFAVELDRALGHLVLRVAHDRVAERALAGAVGAHQRVRLAAADRQVHAAQDRLAFDGHVQVRDLQRFSHCQYSRSLVVSLSRDLDRQLKPVIFW